MSLEHLQRYILAPIKIALLRRASITGVCYVIVIFCVKA